MAHLGASTQQGLQFHTSSMLKMKYWHACQIQFKKRTQIYESFKRKHLNFKK